jgi:hypothetical protein
VSTAPSETHRGHGCELWRELAHSPAWSLAENKMLAFIKRFLLHYGIYRRYPLGRLPALRNAWRVAVTIRFWTVAFALAAATSARFTGGVVAL